MKTIENLFKEGFNLNWKEMEINKPVDVSDLNISVKSLNKEGQIEWNKVLKAIRKPNSRAYGVFLDNELDFKCSSDHKILVKIHENKESTFLTASVLKGKKVYFKTENDWRIGTVKMLDEEIPILDIEVEGSHAYFTNSVYSHNTMFGSPETTPGGNALKFYASIRIDIRKKELLSYEESASQEATAFGQISRYKTVKNKTAPPFKKSEMKVIYFRGIQTEEEWIESCVNAGIIQKGGAGWMTLPNGEKIQGMPKLIELLNSNPKLKEDLINKVKAYESKTQADYLEETEDEVSDEEVVEALLTDEDMAEMNA